MIVDDDKYIRFAVKKLFESQGIEIVTAESAHECLRELDRGFKGVILMDIMMPEVDGWDAIRQIIDKGFYEGNIISMLTAKDIPCKKMEGLQEYVTDYITKPFEPDGLVTVVKEYLDYLNRINR
jgi:DNA-binding response OmpR family regulator